MQISIREVLQLAERCFAAAGFPKGEARAKAESIWWTEAFKGAGLTTLHDLLDELDACDATELTLRNRDATVSVVDGRPQPSIVAGDSVLNLASAEADRSGIGVAYATTDEDDTSLPSIGHLAYKAAERGTVSVVAYADGSDAGTYLGVPTDSKPLLAETEFTTSPLSLLDVSAVVSSGPHPQPDAPLTQTLFAERTDERYEIADELFVERFLRRATASAASSQTSTESGVALLCLDPRHPRLSGGVQRVAAQCIHDREAEFTDVFAPERIETRIETLMHEGVEVDRDVWEDIFEYNTGVLAPPFEGSEQGAGFGLND